MDGPPVGQPARFPGRPLQTTSDQEKGQTEGVMEGRRRREGNGDVLQINTQKTEATSQLERHSDPTQVARSRRSQIVLCDTRAIQQEQDAVCRMSQTPWRCIVLCVFLCICVHVWPSVDFSKRLTNLAVLSLKRLTVNEPLVDKLN